MKCYDEQKHGKKKDTERDKKKKIEWRKQDKYNKEKDRSE